MSPAHQLPANTARSSDLTALIERAATDPTIDIDKMQRLLDMHEVQEMRYAEKAFNAALAQAQAEMGPISTDASNPQTRSRYATYAALDREIRPIYTSFGLAPSFNTEPLTEPDMMRIVGILGHRDGFARRYQIDMPRETKGARGGDVMTRTHATGSALTYGKRYLLVAMFNLAIGDDDDGNAPARRKTYPQQPAPRQWIQTPEADVIDELTGEVIDTPQVIKRNPNEDWRGWGQRFVACVRSSKTVDDVDKWLELNADTLFDMREEKDKLHATMTNGIEQIKLGLVQA